MWLKKMHSFYDTIFKLFFLHSKKLRGAYSTLETVEYAEIQDYESRSSKCSYSDKNTRINAIKNSLMEYNENTYSIEQKRAFERKHMVHSQKDDIDAHTNINNDSDVFLCENISKDVYSASVNALADNQDDSDPLILIDEILDFINTQTNQTNEFLTNQSLDSDCSGDQQGLCSYQKDGFILTEEIPENSNLNNDLINKNEEATSKETSQNMEIGVHQSFERVFKNQDCNFVTESDILDTKVVPESSYTSKFCDSAKINHNDVTMPGYPAKRNFTVSYYQNSTNKLVTCDLGFFDVNNSIITTTQEKSAETQIPAVKNCACSNDVEILKNNLVQYPACTDTSFSNVVGSASSFSSIHLPSNPTAISLSCICHTIAPNQAPTYLGYPENTPLSCSDKRHRDAPTLKTLLNEQSVFKQTENHTQIDFVSSSTTTQTESFLDKQTVKEKNKRSNINEKNTSHINDDISKNCNNGKKLPRRNLKNQTTSPKYSARGRKTQYHTHIISTQIFYNTDPCHKNFTSFSHNQQPFENSDQTQNLTEYKLFGSYCYSKTALIIEDEYNHADFSIKQTIQPKRNRCKMLLRNFYFQKLRKNENDFLCFFDTEKEHLTFKYHLENTITNKSNYESKIRSLLVNIDHKDLMDYFFVEIRSSCNRFLTSKSIFMFDKIVVHNAHIESYGDFVIYCCYIDIRCFDFKCDWVLKNIRDIFFEIPKFCDLNEMSFGFLKNISSSENYYQSKVVVFLELLFYISKMLLIHDMQNCEKCKLCLKTHILTLLDQIGFSNYIPLRNCQDLGRTATILTERWYICALLGIFYQNVSLNTRGDDTTNEEKEFYLCLMRFVFYINSSRRKRIPKDVMNLAEKIISMMKS